MSEKTYYMPANLIALDQNTKTAKGRAKGYGTGILYLAPSNESGVMNTCKFASKGCRAACLYSAGRGRFASVKKGRINKTLFLHQDKKAFFDKMVKDITKHIKKCAKLGITFVCRLNGTSDIDFSLLVNDEGENIFEVFPQVQFYDYTKDYKKARSYIAGDQPKNYHLTFSRSESNEKFVNEFYGKINVAVVFLGSLPEKYKGVEVVNGDLDDLRFLDKKNCIVGLLAKGDAKKDQSGFCVLAKQTVSA